MSGNVDPSMVGVNTIRFQATSAFTQSPYAVFDKFSNPDLRWETVRMFNLGLDFALSKGRLSGSVEYYSKRADDLFGFYPIDYTAGIGTTAIKNVAEIKGSGIDVQVNSKNVSGRFNWTSTLNYSMNRDRVLTYYLAATDANAFVQSSANVSGIEGLPVYS
ncbi:MAG: TonB-dependent receptor, partial [Pedobacter sp.]